MAFLLAATMVAGCATTASAAGVQPVIKAVKDNKSEATNATFNVNKAWNFIGDTDVNGFAAAWSNQKDDTSKGLVAAWRNGYTQSELTARQYNWSTQYAYGGTSILNNVPNEKDIDNQYNRGMYGEWYTNTWDKAKSANDNMTAASQGTNSVGQDYLTYGQYILNTANLFANVGTAAAPKYEISSGYAVILKTTVDNIYNEHYNALPTENKKADDAFLNGGRGYLTTGTVTPAQLDDAVAFVVLNPVKITEANANYNTVDIVDARTDTTAAVKAFFAEGLAEDGFFDAFVATRNASGAKEVYKYDQVSPFEAIELKNVTNYNNSYIPSYANYNMAQANDLYEVMSNKKSIYDANLDGKFNDANGLPTSDKLVRIWRWKDIYSRDIWTARNAQWDEAQKAVTAAWYAAIREDVIKAYNAANGEQKLNDDAKIGDIMYYDIVKTSGDSGKYTLIVGGTAKTVTDQAKAVVALHWNGKTWDKVNAEMQRVNFNGGDDSYGVLLEANSYSPYIIIEVTDLGTSVDATAEAAKTPEKSGKTGVSFLGL